jgi:hypothetical protein
MHQYSILVLPYVAKSHIWGPSARLRDEFKGRNLYPFNFYFDLVDAEKYAPLGTALQLFTQPRRHQSPHLICVSPCAG